jgi:hypothetical protein
MTHERSDRRASTEARLALALALLSALLGASSLVVAPLNGASLLEFINGPARAPHWPSRSPSLGPVSSAIALSLGLVESAASSASPTPS